MNNGRKKKKKKTRVETGMKEKKGLSLKEWEYRKEVKNRGGILRIY